MSTPQPEPEATPPQLAEQSRTVVFAPRTDLVPVGDLCASWAQTAPGPGGRVLGESELVALEPISTIGCTRCLGSFLINRVTTRLITYRQAQFTHVCMICPGCRQRIVYTDFDEIAHYLREGYPIALIQGKPGDDILGFFRLADGSNPTLQDATDEQLAALRYALNPAENPYRPQG